MIVRTFNTGPPPFNAPSAYMDLGAKLLPSFVIRNPENSETMPCPVAMSEEACTVTGKSFGR